jgi:uncharacterized membrane protein
MHGKGPECLVQIAFTRHNIPLIRDLQWEYARSGFIKMVDFFEYLRHIESMVKQRIAHVGILFASLMVSSAAVFPPVWIHFGHGSDLPARGGYFFFSGVCHQIPERSFHFWGEPLAVCSRCSGVYAGFLIGALLLPVVRRGLKGEFPPAWILGAALLPAMADFGLAHLGVYDSGNVLRAATGLIPGATASLFILPGVYEIISGPSKAKGLTCKTNPAS